MNRRSILLISLGVALIVLLIVARKQGWIGNDAKGREVETELSLRTDLIEKVSASGKIQPEKEVKLSPEVSGEIIELPIVEGQFVKKGTLLVRINPDIYQSGVDQAQASVSAAQSDIEQSRAQRTEAEKNHKRNVELLKKGAISQAEFDASQRLFDVSSLAVEAAQARYQNAQASLKQARDNLYRTTLYAPVGGTISMLNVEAGERVVGTAQMAGTELLRISNLSNMEVLVEVNENDIVRVSLGDTADIEVDAYTGQVFKGVVTEIANSAKLAGSGVDQVTNFEVRVRILPESYQHLLKNSTGTDAPFRPGMTASVDIRTEVKKKALAVPVQAVVLRSDTSSVAGTKRSGSKTKSRGPKAESEPSDNEGGETETQTVQNESDNFEVVFVQVGDRAQLKVVKTGIQNERYIEILEGLDEGAPVIVGPYATVNKLLKNGETVKSPKGKKPESKDKAP
ncbi:efflux RND transporter periplasmic adaptor subunit [bacterium]|nr:efflux RND transporter periplasmic adaptor subunit [bacterium]